MVKIKIIVLEGIEGAYHIQPRCCRFRQKSHGIGAGLPKHPPLHSLTAVMNVAYLVGVKIQSLAF